MTKISNKVIKKERYIYIYTQTVKKSRQIDR